MSKNIMLIIVKNNNIWKYLNDKLLEIRAKGQEGIGRSIFCYQKRQKIIILHSFIKKSQKMPKKEYKWELFIVCVNPINSPVEFEDNMLQFVNKELNIEKVVK